METTFFSEEQLNSNHILIGGDKNYSVLSNPLTNNSDPVGITANEEITANELQYFSAAANTSFSGTLDLTDPNNPTRSGRLYDGYYLSNLQAGQQVQINLDARFDTYLQLVNADTGAVIAFNDDGGVNLNSQLTFTAASNTDYIVRATSYWSNDTGAYTLTTSLIGSTPPSNSPAFDSTYGYGLVDATAAVAAAIGQTTFADVPNLGGNLWGNDLVKAPEVWAGGYTGQNVVVAVLDTGVDYNHSDLANNIWTNTGEIAGDGIDNDLNGYVDDIRGWDFAYNDNNPNDIDSHGTHVAGTIAGLNNGIGITGVAYNAQIMPVKVLGDNGFGSFQNIADGIRYAADNGANVINLSLGGSSGSVVLSSAIEYAQNLGAVVVMAAGNDALSEPDYPAKYAINFGISVGAVDINSQIAYFSNRAGLDPSLNHVVAPGVSIYSTVPGGGYAYYDGTSMATPHVAGVVALMLSANPNLTPLQVQQILIESTVGSGIQSINSLSSSNSTGTTISSLNSSLVEKVPSFAEDLSEYEIAGSNSFENDNSSDETETAIIEFENLVSFASEEITAQTDSFGVPVRKYYRQGTEISLASFDFQDLLFYGDKSVVATI